MRIRFRLIFALPWLMACALAWGSNELSLDSAIQEAREHNPELKQLHARLEAASWKRFESVSGYLPHVSLDASHLFATKYARLNVVFGGQAIGFPSAVPQDTINLTASLTVFDGLGSLNSYRAAGYEEEAVQHDLDHAAFKLDQEVRSNFNQALAAAELTEVADENIRSLEEHLTLARASERSGMGTRFNVLRLEAQLEEARAEKVLAEDNLAIARANLARVLGHEGDDNRSLQGQLPQPQRDAAVSRLTLDVSSREDIKAERARESALEREDRAANAFWFPKINLFAQEQFYRFGSFDPVILPSNGLRNAYMLGVNLHWDLFDGGGSYARREEAAARVREAAQKTAAELQKIPADFQLWKRRYLYNSALYRARLRTIEKSNESVRLAKLGLRAGTSTNSEVLDAELDLFRARSGVVRAQADAAEALTRLELAIGHTLAGR